MKDPVLDYLEPRDLTLGPVSQIAGDFTHWTVVRDADDVAWAVLDRKGASANTLSEEVLEELDRLLTTIEERLPKALVLRSAKPSGFLAGADISEFRGVTDRAAILERIERAHAVVDRLEALAIPTIAVMHGYAMGGGLEIALACTYRIAVEGTRFGFPEVRIGLHPGLGGTARFTRQVDPLQAMTYMLTGKTISDRAARKLGLVDAVVPERHVRAAVRDAATGGMTQAQHSMLDRLKDTAPARYLAVRQMRAETEKQAPRTHYPAPHALIDLWEAHGGDFAAMKRAEIESFASLMVGETARNLIRVFFLREALKKLTEGTPNTVRHVHVIGAGIMGGDIAAWCAWQGLRVTLTDVKPEPVGGAVKRAAQLYAKIGHGDGPRIRDALDRLIPDPDGHGVAVADMVIEAAPERADLKRKLYAAAAPRVKPGAILATNTSSIPLDELAEGLARPERLVGIHFFNPVSRLDLVEVIRHDRLDAGVEASAPAFGGGPGHLGKSVTRRQPKIDAAAFFIPNGSPFTVEVRKEKQTIATGRYRCNNLEKVFVCFYPVVLCKQVFQQPLKNITAVIDGTATYIGAFLQQVVKDHLRRLLHRGFTGDTDGGTGADGDGGFGRR